MQTDPYYNEFFEFGQQQIHFNLYQIGLPQDDPVYTLKKVMEELDFTGLTANYSNLGRKGYNPIMMFAILIYANMRGVKAVDRIVELCERDLAFIWLSKGQKPKRDAFYDFINKKLTRDVYASIAFAEFTLGSNQNVCASSSRCLPTEKGKCPEQRLSKNLFTLASYSNLPRASALKNSFKSKA